MFKVFYEHILTQLLCSNSYFLSNTLLYPIVYSMKNCIELRIVDVELLGAVIKSVQLFFPTLLDKKIKSLYMKY